MQHSKVKLTWDDDETERVKKLHQKFNADQVRKIRHACFLATKARRILTFLGSLSFEMKKMLLFNPCVVILVCIFFVKCKNVPRLIEIPPADYNQSIWLISCKVCLILIPQC